MGEPAGQPAGWGARGQAAARLAAASADARERRRARLFGVNIVLFTLGAVFGLAEIGQAFVAYLALAGTTPQPTPSQLASISILAAGSVLAAIASLVVAIVAGGRWAVLVGTLSGIGLVAAILVAALVTSPQGNWSPAVDVGPVPPANQQPCYSGSNTCN